MRDTQHSNGTPPSQFVTVLGHVGYINYAHGFDKFPKTFTFAYTVYASYLVLFINFFIQQYVSKPKKEKKKAQ